jgi:hypothetical protein
MSAGFQLEDIVVKLALQQTNVKSNEDGYETTSCFALDDTVNIINIFIVCTATCTSFNVNSDIRGF